MGDDPDVETTSLHFSHGQADAVDGNGSFRNQVTFASIGDFDFQHVVGSLPLPADHGSGAVDVAGDEVAAEAGIGAERPLEVDAAAGLQSQEVGGASGFFQEVEGQAGAVDGDHGEAAAVVGNAFAELGPLGTHGGFDHVTATLGGGFEGNHGACFFDDSRKHKKVLRFKN